MVCSDDADNTVVLSFLEKTNKSQKGTKVLNKFGFSTQSTGTVEFRLHVVKMKEPTLPDDGDMGEKEDGAEAAEGGSSSTGTGGKPKAGGGAVSKALELSRNTEAVLKAFQRAKLRSKKVRAMTSTI